MRESSHAGHHEVWSSLASTQSQLWPQSSTSGAQSKSDQNNQLFVICKQRLTTLLPLGVTWVLWNIWKISFLIRQGLTPGEEKTWLAKERWSRGQMLGLCMSQSELCDAQGPQSIMWSWTESMLNIFTQKIKLPVLTKHLHVFNILVPFNVRKKKSKPLNS